MTDRIVEIVEPGHMFSEDETAGYIQILDEGINLKKLEEQWFGLGGASYGLTFLEFLLEQDGIVEYLFEPEVHVINYL